MFGFFWPPQSHKGVDRTGNVKGIMRRKAHHKLWTLLLMLLLLGGGTVSAPRGVWAGAAPSDPAPPVPGNPGGGDPDVPTSPGKSPKPNPEVGRQAPAPNLVLHKGAMSGWYWSVRVALGVVYHFIFRI